MTLYRDHRGSLTEAMKTVRHIESKETLILDLQKDLDKYGKEKYDCTKITIKPYIFDSRINWDTYIVCLEGYGVLGFTNGPLKNTEE